MAKKLTKKQILENVKVFTKHVKKWSEYFGLVNWEIVIFGDDMPDSRGCANYIIGGKVVSIFYDIGWLEHPETTVFDLSKTAFHECGEIYMSKIRTILKRDSGEAVADELTHHVIRLLENKCHTPSWEK